VSGHNFGRFLGGRKNPPLVCGEVLLSQKGSPFLEREKSGGKLPVSSTQGRRTQKDRNNKIELVSLEIWGGRMVI